MKAPSEKTRNGICKVDTRISETAKTFTVEYRGTVVYQETPTEITLNHGGALNNAITARINQSLRFRAVPGGVVIRKGKMIFQLYENNKPYFWVPFKNNQYVIVKLCDCDGGSHG